MRCEPLVQFREDRRRGLLIQRGDNSLPFRRGQILHDFRKIRRVQVFKFFVRYAQLHAAHRVRLDKVHEFPANCALRQFALQFAHDLGRHDSLEQPPHGSREPHIDLRQTQLDVAIRAERGQVDVIYTHDLAPTGINDLLI